MPKRATIEAEDPRGPAAASGELRAVLLSLPAALAIPVAGAFLLPVELGDYEALLWLLALIPAFLLAYHRGWRGAATTLAFGMAVLSITYFATQALGRPVPHLLWGVVAFYVGITLGIGWLAERVSKKKFDEASMTLALRDPLTDLPNRRYAEVYLDQEFAAAERGRPLAVVLFDFDNFHEFNAIHGRAAGDGVLRGFANLLRRTTRRMNAAARYGPEEFICVLGSCDEEGAMTFAARVQERLRAAESTVAVPTTSVGIAVYRPGLDTPLQLLSAAEDALLQAKRAGRDRVRVHGRDVTDDSQSAVHSAERLVAQAQSALERVRIDVAPDPDAPLGSGRTACLMISEPGTRSRLAAWLASEAFAITEANDTPEVVAALKAGHDVLFVQLHESATAITDLIIEARHHSEATRIVGVPPASSGSAVPPALLQHRVDAHYIPSEPVGTFRPALAALMHECDHIRAAQLRQIQLSDEVRAKEREGRKALAASEARYHAVIQSIQQVIFATDTEGRWTLLNTAWTSITGFDVDNSIGTFFWEYLHPDERDEVRESFMRLVERTNAYYRHEGLWRTKSGGFRWVESRFQVNIDGNADITGASGVLTDVTDRRRAEDALRRSEEYYRSLIEQSSDMITVVNADGTIRYVSPAVARTLGYPLERWVNLDPYQLMHTDDRDMIREAFADLLQEPGGIITREMRIRDVTGSWRTLEVTMNNHLTSVGVEGVVINSRDVTDRRRAEDALRESEEMLAQSQKMEAIGRLAGGVAHDFNNLLTAIQGHAALLLEQTPVDAEIHSDVKEIRDAAMRATALTRQLLAFSRRQVLQPRLIDVNATVTDMDKMLRRLVGERITIELALTQRVGAVRADPAQLEQVILNLVVNAKDAMPRDGRIVIRTADKIVTSILSSRPDLVPGEYVMLQIEDNGGGMSAEVAEHAFEPFFTTKDPGQGTGLGLATVYGIVKQSGGHIWLESQQGSGTTVTLYLPKASDASGVVTNTPAVTSQSAHGGNETILLVEDEPSVRDLAERVLTRQGYRVITAGNGREALDRFAEHGKSIDLVVSDVVMPVMDGAEMAEKLIAINPGIRVLLMSGYAEEMVLRQGDIGAGRAFIAKPFAPSELLQKIREVIDADR